jgi:hypothetical protein
MHLLVLLMGCSGRLVDGSMTATTENYPTAHEPADCNGVASTTGVTVVIVDATGVSTTLQVNAVGNFYTQVSLTKPFRAEVTSAAGERAMATPQTIGDCNSCHTQDGANGAPGRIMAP